MCDVGRLGEGWELSCPPPTHLPTAPPAHLPTQHPPAHPPTLPLLAYTYPPPPANRIGLSTDIRRVSHHVFFHIWIAYGSEEELIDGWYHFAVRVFFVVMIFQMLWFFDFGKGGLF